MTGSNIEEKIEEHILSKEWSLNDILDMEDTVAIIVGLLIDDMSFEDKFNLIENVRLENIKMTVGKLIHIHTAAQLNKLIQVRLNTYLKTAKVSFDGSPNIVNISDIVEEDSLVLPSSPNKEIEEVVEETLSLKERSDKLKDLSKLKQLTPDEMKELGIL